MVFKVDQKLPHTTGQTRDDSLGISSMLKIYMSKIKLWIPSLKGLC